MPAIIAAVLVLMILISLFFLRKERPKVAYNRMRDADADTLGRLAADVCRRSRTRENGAGINPVFLMSGIRRANRMISAKIRNSEPLSESEKWFYENYYLIYRYVYSRKDNLKSLPHIDGVPRTVVIAKIIVNNSLEGLSAEKIRAVFEYLKDGVNLSYAELKEFNNALSYAILEQLYILSRRLVKQESYKKAAYRRGFTEKYLKSDVYVYYLYHIDLLNGEERDKLARRGLDAKSALINFNNITVRNALMAKSLFGGLREVPSYLPAHIGLRYLGSYQILSKAVNLEELAVRTRISYFSELEKISRKTNADEEYAAQRLMEIASKNDLDISDVLYDGKRALIKYIKRGTETKPVIASKSGLQRLYSLAVILTAVAGSTLTALFFNIVAGVLSFVPLLLIAENVLNYLLSHAADDAETPKMSFRSVPYRHNALVAVSEFIASLEQFKDSLRHLEEINAANGGENVQVAMLVDVKGGDAPSSALDMEIEDYLSSVILADGMNVFIRKKEKIGEKYQGKERKRGAINALNKLLVTRNEEEFSFIYNRNYVTPQYIVTLDADNTLLPGDVTEMVNMMAHPYNRRFDLLACHSKYSLYSLKSRYSTRFLQESGTEVYPTFSGLYYRLFRRDVYCGKGIYRLRNFYNKLEDVFPSGKILSHDIIEGSVLVTGGGATIFEDAPTGFLADRERRKRWQRGDIQLLPFMNGRWKNDENKPCRADIEPIYNFIMAKNILGNLKEICLLAIILFGLFANINALWFGLALFAAPYAVNQIKIFRGIACGVLPRYLLSQTVKNVLLMIEDFFTLSYYAFGNLMILAGTLLRMAKGRKLLEWKTYYTSQNIRDMASYAKEFSLSFAIMSMICVGTAFYSFNAVFLGAYLVLAVFAYSELYATSGRALKRRAPTEREREKLFDYAEKTYKYFSLLMSDGYIIADNLQVKPYKGISETTSPTNIGFSMLAQICACKLGFITMEECCHTLTKILDAVEKLPKWHGNLYNWYNVRTLKPVNDFVSSVDSGNFLASLIIVREFLKENFHSVAELKAELTIANTDLNALFDRNENLFYLGYDGEKFVGHYDLLNSESRILSTVYVALYGNAEHFRCLQRDYASYGGNTLLSWSGTMFEALMPDLFFVSPAYSVFRRTSGNFARVQASTRFKGVWGVSESGFYRFDDELRYQYYAFGLNKLALRNEKNKPVVAPYASALCLDYIPDKVLSNLEKLEETGCFAEYGFYESADMEGKTRIVSSYMSHHQGMTLCAITNYLCENELQRLMKNNIKISAALNLYNELTPKVAFGIKTFEKQNKEIINAEEYSKNNIKIEQYFCASALTDAQYTTLINGFGGGFSKYFDIYINRFSGVYEENDGSFFFVEENGEWYSPTYLPLRGDAENFTMGYTDGEIVHANLIKNAVQKTALLSGLNGEVRKLEVRGSGKEVAFYSSVALNTSDGYRSHPAFNGIFTEAVAEDNILILRRRSLKKDGADFCLGVRVEGVSELVWECNDMNFIGRNGSLKNPGIFRDERGINPSLGDVLHPCAGFRGKMRAGGCQVALMFSEDMKKLAAALNALPDDMYSYALLSSLRSPLGRRTHDVLGELIYLPYSQKTLNTVLNCGKREYFGEKTRWKKLIVYNYSESSTDGFSAFLLLARDLNAMRVGASFAVAVKPGLGSNVVDYIEANLKVYAIKNYSIIKEDDEILKYAFMILNPDMTFTRTRLVLSKLFELESEGDGISAEAIDHGSELFRSGDGGFDEYDAYIADGENTGGLPYSNVICARYGGMVTTDNGGGFFFFDNSRENKMSRFDNDPVTDRSLEFLYAKTASGVHKICGGRGKNRFTVIDRGKTVHVCRENGVVTTVKYSLICEGRARIISVDAANERGGVTEIIYGFFPALNWVYEPDFVTFEQKNDLISVKNLKNNQSLYVRILTASSDRLSVLSERETAPYLEYYFEEEREKIYFVFTQDQGLALSLNATNIPLFEEREETAFKSLSNVDITSGRRSFNILMRYLPYQIASSRLNGKTGFYQVGGATGFRDQLQDSAAFLHSDPSVVRGQILSCARHQYAEGDVMHWWHHPKFGLRTRITDDKLFLPLLTAEYVAYTEDRSILEEELPYLVSPPLKEGEETRFENPSYGEEREPLLKHCLRAIRSALKYGEHGLLVMGSGDWNDGMDYACSEGKGESVFNSMLCCEVLAKFAPLCPKELTSELNRIAAELKTAINSFAFEEDRYKRLFTDDGRWLGSAKSDSLTLDLLVQSYAVISGVADGDRAQVVLNTARKLIDADAGIIKLLDPPSDKRHYLGYISAYPSGVRENGGQYTHAAIWYMIALAKVNRQDEAFELFQMINPVEKCRDAGRNARYMGEPYVLSGDVYSNASNYGRMGWSWYTGSAAWAYRLVLEWFFGLKRRGNKLIIDPRLPAGLDGSVLTYAYGDSVYILEYKRGNGSAVKINGETIDNGEVDLEYGKRERIVVESPVFSERP